MRQSVMAHLYMQTILSYRYCYNHFHQFGFFSFFLSTCKFYVLMTAKHNINGVELSFRAVCQAVLEGLLA